MQLPIRTELSTTEDTGDTELLSRSRSALFFRVLRVPRGGDSGSTLLLPPRFRGRGRRNDVAQRTADDVVVLRQMEPLPTLGHLFLELFIAERDAHAEVDEHVRHRSIPRSLPVPRIRNVFVRRRVVHVADDVEDGAFRQQRRRVVGVVVAAYPVVV